jgi:hypothetical protein
LKAYLITDVMTLLFLLSELIWIKGEDKVGVNSSDSVSLERNGKRVKVGCIIITQPEHTVLTRGFILREFVLDDLSSAPFEMRPCLRKNPVGREIMNISKQSRTNN